MKRWHSAQLVSWSADCSVSAETPAAEAPAGALTPVQLYVPISVRRVSFRLLKAWSARPMNPNCSTAAVWRTAHTTSHVSWQLSRMSRRHSTTAALRVNIGDFSYLVTSVATAAAAWKSLGKSDIYVWIFRGSAVWLDRIFGTLDCHLRRLYFILEWSRPPVLPPCLGWSTIIN